MFTLYRKLALVVGFLVAALLVVTLVGENMRESDSTMPVVLEYEETPVRAEAGVFRTLGSAGARMPQASARDRDLETFYSRRAYPGAPPVIPHTVREDGFIADGCLDCHRDGGYVAEQQAYAPVTPHPDYGNCMQCHVASDQNVQLFAATDWRTVAPPPLDTRALMQGPPIVPHDLQLRENCHACHTGPGAVKEIRTDHFERTHCRQCHVPAHDGDEFARAAFPPERDAEGGNDAH